MASGRCRPRISDDRRGGDDRRGVSRSPSLHRTACGVRRREFSAERRRATPATLIADLLIALALLADGVIMSQARPLAAVLTLALGVGIGLARLVVEPSTTTATFGRA